MIVVEVGMGCMSEYSRIELKTSYYFPASTHNNNVLVHKLQDVTRFLIGYVVTFNK